MVPAQNLPAQTKATPISSPNTISTPPSPIQDAHNVMTPTPPFNYYLPVIAKVQDKKPVESLSPPILRLLENFISLANLKYSPEVAIVQPKSRLRQRSSTNPSSAHKFLSSRPILVFSFYLCLNFKFKFRLFHLIMSL